MSQKKIFTDPAPARPFALSLIAWSWLISGVLMVFGAAFSLFAGSAISSAEMAAQLPPEFAAMVEGMKESRASMIVQLVVGALAITAGAQLLGLRAWARTAVEILSWLAAAYIAFAVWRSSAMLETMSAQLAQGAMVDPAGMRNIGLLVAALVVAAFLIPLALMIKYLRSRHVRELVRNR